MTSQAQRRKETQRKDKADAMFVARRAGHTCEICGAWCPYDPGYGGERHHIKRKPTAEIRHNLKHQVWLCKPDHRRVHDQGAYSDRLQQITDTRDDEWL